MNMIRSVSPIVMLIASVFTASSTFASPPQHYIVMARHLVAQPNATPSPGLITDAEIALLGGSTVGRAGDRVIITLPEAALSAVEAHAVVKYVQRTAVGPQPVVTPSITAADMPAPGLRPATSALRPELQWSIGDYRYDGAGNIKNAGPHLYTYDALSRLKTDQVGGAVVEQYTYDPFGNMTQRVTNGLTWPIAVNSSTNRLTGVGYDTAGNVTTNGTAAYLWDPFSMMREHNSGDGSPEVYVYTASDERIGVRDGEYWVWSFRDESGKVLRQYDSVVMNPSMPWRWIEDYVYRDGLLLGAERPAAEGGQRHFHLDHLGSPRLVTGGAGVKIAEHEFRPFGNEITPWQYVPAGFDREEPMKFTGHERDYAGGTSVANTNYLDYMHARFANPNWGRFLSTDPVFGDEWRPQSWNRFAYVEGNPVAFTDPTGMWRMTWESVRRVFRAEVTVHTFTDDYLIWLSDAQYAQAVADFDAWSAAIFRDAGRATVYGAAAFADGAIPFIDPLSELYSDGSVAGTEYSYLSGELTRDVEIALAATGSRTLFGPGRWINHNPLGKGRLRIGHSEKLIKGAPNRVYFSVRGHWVTSVSRALGSTARAPHWNLWVVRFF